MTLVDALEDTYNPCANISLVAITLENVGVSPVCNPVSTSVVIQFKVALTVP